MIFRMGYLPLVRRCVFGVVFFIVLFTDAAWAAHSVDQLVDIPSLRARIHLDPAEKQWITDHSTVRVRLGHWAPMMFMQDGPKGIVVDYLSVLAMLYGIDFQYLSPEDVSWPDSLRYLEERRVVDLIPALQKTPSRTGKYAFTKPYQTLPWVIVTRDTGAFVGGVEDLAGKRVSVPKDFILDRLLTRDYPEIELVRIMSPTSTVDSLREVATGRVDATINTLPIVHYFIQQYGLSNLKVASPAGIPDIDVRMAVRTDWPELALIIDKAVAAMTRQERNGLRERWLGQTHELGIPVATVLWWGAGGGVVAGLALLFIALLNRTLKRKVEERTAALRESRETLRRMVEHAPLAMGLSRMDGRIEYFNPRFVSVLGWSGDDIPTLDEWFVRAYPDPVYRQRVAETWMRDVRKAEGTGEPVVQTWTVASKDGSRREIEFHHTMAGSLGVTIFLDVTERNRASEIMVQSAKMLSVGSLAAGMAHEINNPLGGIIQAVQNAKRRCKPDLPANRRAAAEAGIDLECLADYMERRGLQRYLDDIHSASLRAAQIIRNMLDFSRRSNTEYTPEDINEILEKAVHLAGTDYNLDKDFDFRKIELDRLYEKDIPKVRMGSIEMEQVFFNLLKNAAHAFADKEFPEGDGPRIVLQTAVEDSWLRIDVADNGPGMDKETQQRIFEPFFTTKAPGAGTGLGLSVSYFIVTKNHGGQFEVEAEPGKGTRFIIRLPLGNATDFVDSTDAA